MNIERNKLDAVVDYWKERALSAERAVKFLKGEVEGVKKTSSSIAMLK